MKRDLKKSEAVKTTLESVKGKKVKGSKNYVIYENGVLLNTKTGYATYGSTSGNTPFNVVTISQYGTRRTVEVQRLMAECYMKANWKVNEGKEANHIDGNPNNNSLSNLKLVTRDQNVDHAINVLGRRFGRVSNLEVLSIRESYVNYKSSSTGIKNLAKRYNLNTEVVSNIVNRITYRNI